MHFVKTFALISLLFGFFTIEAQKNQTTSVKLLHSNNDETVMVLKMEKFSTRKIFIGKQPYLSLLAENGYPILEKGNPEVLKISQSIIIPDESNTKLEVVSSEYTDYQNFNLIPSKGNLLRTVNPSDVAYEFSSCYKNNSFFPGKLAELQTPYILRDFRGQSVVFYPFQYNPVTKTLRFYHTIKIKVSKTSGNSDNVFIRSNNIVKDEEFASFYESHFLNFNQQKYTAIGESGPMLIIANQSYMSAMQPFVSWKIKSGRKVTMVSIQSIGNTPTAIKNYINTQYVQNGISFVLFVGDAQHITPNNSTSSASDNFYGYLSGNDSYPEVIIGRFSAESLADVQTQVARTINYELNVDTTFTHFKRNIGIGSDQGPGDDNEYDYQHIQNLQTQLGNYTYNYKYQFFEGSQGGNDASGDPTPSMLAGALNDGAGMIVYTGHGSNSSFVTTGFSNSNVSALTNMNKLPFIWSVACVNGEFVNNTCFAEYWLRSQNNGNPIGAVAVLMSTINQSWNPPMEGHDEMVALLTESYTNNIKRTFGALSMNACMKMNDTYGTAGSDMTDTWTIFGDPSIMVRTDIPGVMTINHPASISLGASQMMINCSKNGALITLSKNDSILAKGTVINNAVTLSFPAISNLDSINIVAIAYNKIPYVSKIQVLAQGLPFVSPASNVVNDSLTNNNQALEINETVFISQSLINSGMVNSQAVNGKLTSASPLITVIDSLESFGNINTNSTITHYQAYKIKASANIPDQTSVPLNLKISDANSNIWNYSIPMIVNSPELIISESNFIENIGNGNNKPDAGETYTLKVRVNNSGHSGLDSLFAQLSCNSSFVNLNSAGQNSGYLAVGAYKEFNFNFQIAANCPVGTVLNFNFSAQRNIYSTSISKSVKVGIVDEDFESKDFGNYQWIMGGDYPWIIDSLVYFEGGASARSGLSTTDDNKNSVMQLNLKVQTADSISFYVKVSSEDGGTSFYDYLEFKTGNMIRKKWQGDVDWTREAFYIGSGLQSVIWTYYKDVYYTEGSDCAWIDYIVFPPLMDETSLENVCNNMYMNLFPNPSNKLISIEFNLNEDEFLQIQLIDLNGKILRTIESNQYQKGKNRVETSMDELSSGAYFIKITGEKSTAIRKFMKF